MMKNEFRFYLWTTRLIGVSQLVNLGGAALALFYFFHSQSPDRPYPMLHDTLSIAVSAAFVLVVLIGGTGFLIWKTAPMFAWYHQASQKESGPAPMPICRLALNYPAWAAGVALGFWILAGAFYAILNAVDFRTGQVDWLTFGEILVGVSFVVGPTTAILDYFATERAWRPHIPLFFAHADLTKVAAFRLQARSRLVILFVLGTMPLILLALLTYRYASQMVQSAQPALLLPRLLTLELILSAGGIALAVVLARTLGSSLIEPLEVLGPYLSAVEDGRLDQRVPVTSNDEIGLLAARFNHMMEGVQRRDVELRTIYKISREITDNLELDQTLQAILEEVRQIVPYDGGEICLHEKEGDLLRVRAWTSSNRVVTDTRGRAYKMGEGYTGWVGQRRQSLLIPDVDAHAGQKPVVRQIAEGVFLNGYLGVPLLVGQKMVGTLEIVSTQRNAFSEHDRQILEIIAPQAAIAIQNAEQVLERERNLKAQIEQLKIQIDQVKREKQVAEITETTYFQQLKEEASRLREASQRRSNEKTQGK